VPVKRLLDHDPLSGLTTWHNYDESSDTTILTHEQDAQPLLDACKRDSNHADRKLGAIAHVASVPVGVQLEWVTKYGVRMWDPDHKPAVARLLDGEYKHLKRLPIHIGGY
jgi:hypothetical protein